MIKLLRRFLGLFRRGVRVVPEGKGYRVNGEWCNSQVEVRQRLEDADSETQIRKILRQLNIEKYGDAQR